MTTKEGKSLTRKYIEGLEDFAKSKDISILSLCDMLETHASSFYRWKDGHVNMTLKTVSKFNAKLEEIYGENVEISLS